MRILISGATGLIGTALCEHLRSGGHTVVRLVRSKPTGTDVTWDPAAGVLPVDSVAGVDAVVNLSGAGIGDHRWTDEYKRTLLDSRLSTTELLASTIAAAEQRPSVFISGSAVGFYGPRGDEQLNESDPGGDDFLADICRRWEAATAAAEAASVRTVHIRTGIVLSGAGGALKKQLPLFKLGLGGRFGNGRQWQSWISIVDHVRAVDHLLTAELAGPVNLTAPAPVTNAAFTRTLAHVVKRPAILPIPGFAPKLLLGGELVDALLLTGQRVIPAALEASGFEFEHSTLEPALRAVLAR